MRINVTEIWMNELNTILKPEQMFPEEPMSRHTSFRIGGPAQLLVTPSVEQLPLVVGWCRRQSVPYTVIGNGSNLLVGDGGIRGITIVMGVRASGITVDGTKVRAAAGALLAKAALAAADAGLTGMEFAAGIPGSIGGAVVMNAGAYGGEMKDIVTAVRVLTKDGEVVTRQAAELEFGYRCSAIMENQDIVLEAVLELTPGDRAAIGARMQELKGQRTEKQPLEWPSAGSTFKRPQGYFAGKLIMDAGLRGFRVGDAQVSEKHCGFIVNRGQATAEDVEKLIHEVQQRVRDQFGVELTPEVRRIGEFL